MVSLRDEFEIERNAALGGISFCHIKDFKIFANRRGDPRSPGQFEELTTRFDHYRLK